MNTAYKTDERVLQGIVRQGITPLEPNTKIDLRIYYKNYKTSSLVMCNNLCAKKRQLDRCNVVYQYSCQIANCKSQNTTYIGNTATSLSRRLTMHLQSGSIKNHTRDAHNTTLTRDMLVNNTIVLDSVPETRKLHFLEAIYIDSYKPNMNIQGGNSTITLPSNRYIREPDVR